MRLNYQLCIIQLGGAEMKMTLRALRVNQGLTQFEVAKELKIHFQTLRNWEVGKIIPSKKKLEMLAKYYGTETKNIKMEE